MQVRLVVSIRAAKGRGGELLAVLRKRAAEVLGEDGCEQYEIFQSGEDADSLVLLERWQDQAALDAHAALMKSKPPIDPEIVAGVSEREDYIYNRTR